MVLATAPVMEAPTPVVLTAGGVVVIASRVVVLSWLPPVPQNSEECSEAAASPQGMPPVQYFW